MERWKPISRHELIELLEAELRECPPPERATFDLYRVEPVRLPFAVVTTIPTAFVVARRGDEVIYYEDVEGGFETSSLDPAGRILEHWFGQDPLLGPLHRWTHVETPVRDPDLSQLLDLVEKLDIEGRLRDEHLSRRFMLQCLGLLVLPEEARSWLSVAERYDARRATVDELESARVAAWQFLGSDSSGASVPGGRAVRAAICALYPRQDPDPFDHIINFAELFIEAGGTESAATEIFRKVSSQPATGT